MPADPRTRIAVALAVVALAAHVHFHVLDTRPVVDLGHYYAGAVQAVLGAETGSALRLDTSGSPYGAVLALLWSGLGLHAWVLETVDGLWLVALLVGMGLCGRALGGAAGAVTGVAAVLALPLFPTMARTHWIHHAEVASATLALGLALRLTPRAGPGLLVGLVAALGPMARPSALVWCSVPLLLWTWRARRQAWSAWLPLLTALALQAPGLLGYLQMRLALRGEMQAAVGNPFALWHVHLGVVPALVLLGLALRGAARPRAGDLAALAWLVGGVAVIAVTGAGLDNVPTAFAGLALLAARGAARIGDRLGAALLALVLVGPLTQLVPTLGALGPATGWEADDHGLNWLVPRGGLDGNALGLAARTVCPEAVHRSDAPGEGTCVLWVQRGLVHPSWEDDGNVGLVLAGWRGVQLVSLTGPSSQRRPDGVIAVERTGPAPDPTGRFGDLDPRFEQARRGRREVATVVGHGATLRFFK